MLRHCPKMKLMGLIIKTTDRRKVKLACDQPYRAKIRTMDLIQGF